MQITKNNLIFSQLKQRTTTSRIIIHHSASSDVSAAEIHRWHKNQGFSGIGYHYLIRKNGKIEEGRPLDSLGAHAGNGGNPDSVGICLTGNFQEYSPEPIQIDALVKLIQYLNDHYKKNLQIIGHKDINPTACPGQHFPWPQLQEKLTIPDWQQKLIKAALEKGLITEWHNPQEVAPKCFVIAVSLNILKKLGGMESENQST
ncbi:MAG TPA: N-acetylmuramoyl-L-alanine amidase [Syntrophomonadaceae bacterium]|nr:N-acetylmuramoyl-L-alanine amidase [Syntrophomonadaceae bacterium]